MKNTFYFMLKALLFLKYLDFCPDVFVHVGKRVDKKVKVNFRIYDVTDWEKNNCTTHIARYLKKLKVHLCRFENLPVSSSSYENNMLKISH